MKLTYVAADVLPLAIASATLIFPSAVCTSFKLTRVRLRPLREYDWFAASAVKQSRYDVWYDCNVPIGRPMKGFPMLRAFKSAGIVKPNSRAYFGLSSNLNRTIPAMTAIAICIEEVSRP